jgi:DNA-directed RNA polymerase subunit RPC12/RpoP
VCVHCEGSVEVARRAMSVFCPHCKKRLILEDFKIKTYHASRLLATCGSVVVEPKGILSGPVRANSLKVRGQMQGNVDAHGVVEVSKTGNLRGDIRAFHLKVASGAVLNGYFRISPDAFDDSAVQG